MPYTHRVDANGTHGFIASIFDDLGRLHGRVGSGNIMLSLDELVNDRELMVFPTAEAADRAGKWHAAIWNSAVALADPEASFPLRSMTRREVADELNWRLEEINPGQKLAPDDPRLTDAVCARYAEYVGDANEEDDEDRWSSLRISRDIILRDLDLIPKPHDRLEQATVTIMLTIDVSPNSSGAGMTRDNVRVQVDHAIACLQPDLLKMLLSSGLDAKITETESTIK